MNERKKETCNKVQSKFLLNNDVGCIAKRMPRLFSAACVCMVARKERQYYSPVDPSVQRSQSDSSSRIDVSRAIVVLNKHCTSVYFSGILKIHFCNGSLKSFERQKCFTDAIRRDYNLQHISFSVEAYRPMTNFALAFSLSNGLICTFQGMPSQGRSFTKGIFRTFKYLER